jgi:hypothetical protein
MAEEIEIDPSVGAVALGAAEQLSVNPPPP